MHSAASPCQGGGARTFDAEARAPVLGLKHLGSLGRRRAVHLALAVGGIHPVVEALLLARVATDLLLVNPVVRHLAARLHFAHAGRRHHILRRGQLGPSQARRRHLVGDG